MVSGMALTTPTVMASRTDAPADKVEAPVAVVPVAEGLVAGPAAVAAEVLAVAYPTAVVASTRRRGKCPLVARAKPCTHAWFILASGIW